MNDIDISIIITTYNRLWCLPDAIESCRNSEANVEIIVIDDGSNDGTWEWLSTQQDIVALRQPNWGKPWAVNRATSIAKGEFVRFLDSDDMLPSHANDLQLAIARNESADVVVAGYIAWDEANQTQRVSPWRLCDDFIAQQLGECDSSHCYAYLFRKSFIADVPHRPDFAFRDDRLFIIEVALKEPRVAVCDEPCLIHRHHTRGRLQFQQSLPKIVQNWQHLQLYRKAIALLDANGQLDARRKKAPTIVLWRLAHWIAYTNVDEACELVGWIHELDPDFESPEKGALGLLYRQVGFRRTERILKLRRLFFARPLAWVKKAAQGAGA